MLSCVDSHMCPSTIEGVQSGLASAIHSVASPVSPMKNN